MPHADVNIRKAYNKKWREEHKEYHDEYGKKWRKKYGKEAEHSYIANISDSYIKRTMHGNMIRKFGIKIPFSTIPKIAIEIKRLTVLITRLSRENKNA